MEKQEVEEVEKEKKFGEICKFLVNKKYLILGDNNYDGITEEGIMISNELRDVIYKLIEVIEE